MAAILKYATESRIPKATQQNAPIITHRLFLPAPIPSTIKHPSFFITRHINRSHHNTMTSTPSKTNIKKMRRNCEWRIFFIIQQDNYFVSTKTTPCLAETGRICGALPGVKVSETEAFLRLLTFTDCFLYEGTDAPST